MFRNVPIIALCVTFFIMGCGAIFPVDPVTELDSGTPDDCPAACENLKRLQCEGWQGSPGPDEQFGTEDDLSCERVCLGVMSEPTATLFPICTAKAADCEAVELCFQGGQ